MIDTASEFLLVKRTWQGIKLGGRDAETSREMIPSTDVFHKVGGVIIQWGHTKVKTKVHDPPNLIPMIDTRCFA